jgi:nucleotide-binding universal stress UspA family protein
MKNLTSEKNKLTSLTNPSFTVRQALAAIELGKTDSSIFNYLHFFSSLIPVEKKAFVHVIPDLSLLHSFYEKAGDLSFSKYDIKMQLAEDLAEEINQYFPAGTSKLQYVVLEGDPLEMLLENADDIHADLLIIGLDSSKSFHNILGKNLIRKSKQNVLVIPNYAPAVLTRILVPIDFSENSKRALSTAIAINRQLEEPVRITCLHVFDTPNLSHFKVSRSQADYQSIVRENVAEALTHFLEPIAAKDRSFIDTELHLKDAHSSANCILDAAGKHKAELVIMGGTGHTKVQGLLLGSVAEKFLSINKYVPTLVVK